MRYTENGLTFTNVKEGGLSLVTGPFERNGVYNYLGGDVMELKPGTENLKILNCIDIDWNGVKVDLNTTINTTSELLNWIKKSFSESGNFDASKFSSNEEGDLYYDGILIYDGATGSFDASRFSSDQNGNLYYDGILIYSGVSGNFDASRHYEFRYKSAPSRPAAPATGSDGLSDGWSKDPIAPDFENGEYTWMTLCSVLASDNGDVYGFWTTPIRITGDKGEDGADGTDIEFIYTRNNTGVSPTPPATTQQDDWYGTYNGIVWTDNPKGITEELQYEYVSVRYKLNKIWSSYSQPVIWSKWGEKGQDGDGFEYIYKRSDIKPDETLTPSNYSDASSDYQTTDEYVSKLTGWTDDPKGVDSTPGHICEWVATRKRKNGVWLPFSEPALWANYAASSAISSGRYVSLYKQIPDADSCSVPTGDKTISEMLSLGWSQTRPVQLENQYIWQTEAFFSGNINTQAVTWSNAVRLTGGAGTGGNGTDANDIEFIYYNTNTRIDWNLVTTNLNPTGWNEDYAEDFQQQDYTGPNTSDNSPKPWKDNPTGISEENKYEYMSQRRYNGSTKTWGAFTKPALWANWGETGTDGDGVQYVFKVFDHELTEQERIANTPSKDNSTINTEGEWIPNGEWTDEPSGVIEGQYEYVSIIRCIKEVWGDFSKPAIWAYGAKHGSKIELRQVDGEWHWFIDGVDTGIIGEGKNGTGVEMKGSVDVLFNSDKTGNLTSLEGLTNVNIGDCYTVKANGHIYFYDGSSVAKAGINPAGWTDLGEFRGQPGTNSYMHMAWADDILFDSNDKVTVVGATGFIVTYDGKLHDWIGFCTDNNINDPTNFTAYKWNYVKGADGNGYEYVYLQTKKEIAPIIDEDRSDSNNKNHTQDEFLPFASNGKTIGAPSITISGVARYLFTDDPQGVNENYPYEYLAVRKKVNGVWLAFSEATLHRVYGGDTPITAYRWYKENTVPETSRSIPTNSEEPTYANSNSSSDKWTKKPTSYPAGNITYLLWMITSVKHPDGTIDTWSNPVCISGEDSKETEWIYRLGSAEGYNATHGFIHGSRKAEDSINGEDTVSTTDDFVPIDWTDNPTGVSKNNPIEYASYRKYNKTEKKWGKFLEPIIWSHWGRNGMDGDGIEYIFIRTKHEIAPIIADSSNKDSQGRSGSDDEYLPSAYTTDGDNIELNYLSDSEHPALYGDNNYICGECTDDNKGVEANWPFEWFLIKRMSSPDANGQRHWIQIPEGTQMKIWQRYSMNSDEVDIPEEVAEDIAAAKELAEEVDHKLKELHLESEQDLLKAINDQVETWEWFKSQDFPLGEVFDYYYDSVADDQAILDNPDATDEEKEAARKRMQTRTTIEGLGFLKDDDGGTTYTKLKHFVNGNPGDPSEPTLAELTTSVGDLSALLGEDGKVDYESLGTQVAQKIITGDNDIKQAIVDLESFWGTYSDTEIDPATGQPKVKNLKEYIKSALKTVAQEGYSSASLFSDMKTETGEWATSAVQTSLGYKMGEDGKPVLVNGKPVLEADSLLASTIHGEVTTSTAGLATKVYADEAASQLFSKLKDENTDEGNELMAAVRTSVKNNLDPNNNYRNLAEAISGLYTGADEDAIAAVVAKEAIKADGSKEYYASLFAKNGKFGAAIEASANDVKSSLSLKATDITLSGNTTIQGNTTVEGALTALNGLITDSATAKLLHTYAGDTALNQVTKESKGAHVVIENGYIEGYEKTADAASTSNNVTKIDRYAFNADGSGWVANKNILWDANGKVTINSKNVNAGSKYNTLDIYKWTLRPVSFDSTYQDYGYSLAGLKGKFNYELMLGYRIIKNGFVVKDGMYRTENVINPPTNTPQEFHGGPYFNEGGITGRTWNNRTQQWEESHSDNIYYILYGYKYSSITSASALNFLKQVKTGASDLFNGMFKLNENDSSYIFDSGDTLYVSFPDNIVSYDPGIVTVDQLGGFMYETNESTGKVTAFNDWLTGYPILWANTTSSSSPYLHDILILMLTDLVGSSKASTIFNDLFNYNDDPDSVLKRFAGWEEGSTSYEDNLGKLNVNARELYLVWKYKDITTADYTTEWVEKWNQYKTNYIEALNSGNYSKGSLVTLSQADLMYDMSNAETLGYTNYYEYSIHKAGLEFNKLGNTLSPVLKPLISDAEIVVNWEDVIAE